ncbi:inositol polyphosphate phosphatase, putative [Acanthamoeba castellanii str. Neff]|uniref:Inositol polyphosphate phosphatase, putative n=1 Tax=Acanthamoeba castellanii (strain ATCC 30010 / Neff) TaxID=1257118 RepID=L8H4T3_ACACF|nr:inositol polyphosphate phosphatase, putative [Acanthamoeba castellanii str. Neff]ELR19471.1 inositol polyphosphate phosphatase, putative [Acanthamoeba castellanii str. Neff]
MGFQTIGDARSFLKLPPYMSISRTRHRSGGRWATIDDEVDHHSPRLLEPRSPRGQLAASQPPFEVKSVAAPTDVILTRRVAPDVGHGFGGKNCDVCLPFVVEKVVGRGTRKKPLVIEVDFPGRTLRYRYPDGRKPTFQRPHHTLLQVLRSHVNEKKLKLLWSGREKFERLLLPSREQLERFYEAAWAVRRDRGGGDSVEVFVGTWNMGNAPPQKCLSPWLQPEANYDLYAISAQEVNSETDLFKLVQAQLGEDYVMVATQSLMMMRLMVLVRREHRHRISGVTTGSVPTGIGNVIGNKGGLGIALKFIETSLCFVGSHLAARDERVYARNENYRTIVNHLRLTDSSFDLTNHFHALFFFGDLNYRINTGRAEVLRLIAAERWDELCEGDQLLIERKHKRCFAGFTEPPIRFAPSYRYNRGDRTYSEEKMRTPSYCDRILCKTPPNFNVECHAYASCDQLTTSDHSPVFGVYSVPLLYPDMHMVQEMAVTRNLEQGFGMGLDVMLTDVTLTLVPPPPFSPGFAATVLVKSPSPYLSFHAPFLASQSPTITVPRTTTATWSYHQLHTISPSRAWLANQHMWILVHDSAAKDSASPQGVISLDVKGTEPRPFRIKLFASGLRVGKLTGSVAIAESPTKHERQEEDIEAESTQEAATVKQGYLSKEGHNRKSWKRRWFVLYSSGTLSYYSSPSARAALNDVRLRNGTVMALESMKRPTLKLEVPRRVFYIATTDQQELASWVDALSRFTQPGNGSDAAASS